MKRSFSFILLLFAVLSLPGQELPTITPPSPEASSLSKMTITPVSHYTGVPSISVPFHSIDLDGLQIPISLSYHARGIKVNELAPRVGIGWSLNYGGVITRQTRGKPDDVYGADGKGYLTQNYYDTFHQDETVRQDVFNDDIVNEADLIPDLFIFNFPGASGKFIFDQKTKKPLLQSYEDLNIQPFYKNVQNRIIESWIITNAQGFKFYFGKYGASDIISNKDVTITNYVANSALHQSPGSNPSHYNSWQLVKIVSPKGNSVDFEYEKESSVYYSRSYDKIETSPTSYFSKTRSEEYKIKSISFDGGKIEFNNNTVPREDLQLGYNLQSIVIQDDFNSEVKEFQLSYSYSNNTNSLNINPFLNNLPNYGHKRMFLDKIERISTNGDIIPYREFQYINKNDLPNRFSNSQDLWGYYNGADNGQFLTFNDYGTTSVNRKVDILKAQTGLLQQISFPTGGYTRFEYEANRAKSPSYFNDLLFNNMNPTDTQNILMLKNPAEYVGSGKFEKPFSVTGQVSGNTNYSVNFTGQYGICSSTQHLTSCDYQVSLIGINGTNYSAQLYMGNHAISGLPIGDYKIVVQGVNTDPNDFVNAFSVHLSSEILSSNPNEEVFSGGNRIKTISVYDGLEKQIQKSYEYLSEDGTSSGLVYSLPGYYFKEQIVNGVPVVDAYGSRAGSPLSYAQGNHVGYSRVIEYIDDANNSTKGSGGKTEYTFTAMPDGGEFYTFPYTVPADNEWLRGKLLTQKSYKKTTTGYKLISEIENRYIYTNHSIPNNFDDLIDPFVSDLTQYQLDRDRFNLPLIVFTSIDGTFNGVSNHNTYKSYNLFGGIQKLYDSKTTQYDDNEIPTLITTTKTSFNFNSHYQTSSIQTFTSDGEPVFQTFTYPQDLVSGYSVHPSTYNTDPTTALAEQHRFVPLETSSLVDANDNGTADLNEELSKTKTIYDWDGDILEPSVIQSGKDINPNNLVLEDRVEFKDYDQDGNLLQVKKKDGMEITYIYGYDNTLPVAKIENATYAQVMSYVSNIQSKSNLDNDHCLDSGTCNEKNLRTALDALRNGLPNAMVTTYTYDPLIGVTSMTDAKGYTVYYQYDDLNRLERVLDDNGHVLSENKYHYFFEN